jgi:60 kDa SS-A/Ro ribonucleoprotein
MFLRPYAHQRPVPQTIRANPREVLNEAGGYVYPIDKWAGLDRFLVIGTQGGTYYAGERKITQANVDAIKACLDEDGPRVVARVVEISQAGRAPKQDYGLFVLALAAAVPTGPVMAAAGGGPAANAIATRQAAYAAIPEVCRTASTLFQFLAYRKANGHISSRGLRTAIAKWYNSRPVSQLAYQMVKYGQRHGYTHRDVLRFSHANPELATIDGAERAALYRWAVGKLPAAHDAGLPPIVVDAAALAQAGIPEADRGYYARAIPREALPTEWLNDPKVWEALLYGEDGKGMPLTALIRNLGNLSKSGLLTASSDAARYVAGELTNQTRLRQARIHPLALFLAAKVYGSGRGQRGSGTWAPVGSVLDALARGFELAFGNVEPTGKRIVVGLDRSGSMHSMGVLGMELTAAEAGAAMALIHARTEPNARVIGFDTTVAEIKVSADATLERFKAQLDRLPLGGGTDLSLPFKWADGTGQPVDAVLVYTDNETWAGREHPDYALAELRRKAGSHVRAVVASTTATATAIADPMDPLVLQMAGFDTALPQVITAFITGAMG